VLAQAHVTSLSRTCPRGIELVMPPLPGKGSRKQVEHVRDIEQRQRIARRDSGRGEAPVALPRCESGLAQVGCAMDPQQDHAVARCRQRERSFPKADVRAMHGACA
jgi:hypothetical protein